METELIGISEHIENIRSLIDRIANCEANVLITGETGVGKEVVVRSLYQKSKRFGKPFCPEYNNKLLIVLPGVRVRVV